METGHLVFLEVVSIFPPLVLVKKHCKRRAGKEAFQGKFVVMVEDSLVNFSGKTSRISASLFSSSSVICVKIFKHGPYFLPRKGYDSVSKSASSSFEQSSVKISPEIWKGKVNIPVLRVYRHIFKYTRSKLRAL